MVSVAQLRSGSSRALRGDGRAALTLGAATLLGPIGGFAANIVYARTLGPAGRGDLAAIVAALAVCEAVLAFGVPDVLTRHVATRSVPRGALRRILLLGIAGAVVPAVLLSWWATDRGFGIGAAVLAGAVVPVASVAAMGRGVLAGRRAFSRLAAVLVAGGVARLIAPAVLLLANREDPDLALILIAGSTFVASVPVFLARPFLDPGHQGLTTFNRVLTEALSLWPASMAWSLNSRLDQLVLAFLVAPSELGLYAVCVTLAELPIVLASGLRQVILVRASEREQSESILRMTRYILAVGALAAVISLVVGGHLMGWIFGAEFGSVADVLAALVFTSSLMISAGLLNSTLIAGGLGKLTVVSQGAGLVLSVGLLLVVIPLGGGILGASLVSVATYSMVYIIAANLVRSVSTSVEVEGSEK